MDRKHRQIWIVINFVMLMLVIFIYYTGKNINWPVWLLITGGIVAILFVISFIKAYIKTGLWKFSHSKDTSLDERQLQVVLNALKYSYGGFTVITLLIIYGFALAEKGPIDVIIAACLLYLAHILPAAIVGWKEKII